MGRKPENRPIDGLLTHLDQLLRVFGSERQRLLLRDKVLRLVEIQHRLADLGVSVVFEEGICASAARERIRAYLVMHVGTPISGEELQVVSGISEYARRLRELRVESGFQIASGASADPAAGVDLRPDQYLLVSAAPDTDSARRWHVANRIRRTGQSSRGRLLEFFQEHVGQIVTTEELAYVAGDAKSFGRRVRELRTEEGYMIATRLSGRPDLSVGQYVLESLERRAEPHDRRIPDVIQREVYERDQSKCCACGWIRERWRRDDPRLLELHHVEDHAGGGANVSDNLVVLCSRCHDEVHAGRIKVVRRGSEISFHAD